MRPGDDAGRPAAGGHIPSWRLHSQRLAGSKAPAMVDVVSGLLAVQAENHSHAAWAVASRTTGLAAPEFARQFDTGAILRTHVLRPTWHYVRPDDIRWLLDLTRPGVRRAIRSQQAAYGLDDATVDRAAGHIAAAVAGGNHLTREELRQRLAAEGMPVDGMAVMTAHAELSALVCSGAMKGKQQTYASLEERAPKSRRLGREEALAELALRYFTGHGPATERDLAYWATLPLRDVRAGLAAVSGQLVSFEQDGRTFWAGSPEPVSPPSPRAHLLQILDEYYRGYQDSRWALDTAGLARRGREPSMGMVVIDGLFAGDVRRTVASDRVEFVVGLRREIDQGERAALHEASDRYAAFLGLPPVLTLTATGPPGNG